jgi:hypothetical protein
MVKPFKGVINTEIRDSIGTRSHRRRPVQTAKGDEGVSRVYPTVQAAVDSVRHSNDADR